MRSKIGIFIVSENVPELVEVANRVKRCMETGGVSVDIVDDWNVDSSYKNMVGYQKGELMKYHENHYEYDVYCHLYSGDSANDICKVLEEVIDRKVVSESAYFGYPYRAGILLNGKDVSFCCNVEMSYWQELRRAGWNNIIYKGHAKLQ